MFRSSRSSRAARRTRGRRATRRAALTLVAVAGFSSLSACAEREQEPAARPGEVHYVALGDSFTAAPGVPDTPSGGFCLRSTGNYPSLIAAAHPGVRLDDRSCAGASTENLAFAQGAAGQIVAPQLDAVREDTDLVTLSIGANNNSLFHDLVITCPAARALNPTGSPCQDSTGREGAAGTSQTLSQLTGQLVAAVADIRSRAPQARVVIVGYPQLLPESGSCPDRIALADGDVSYVRDLNERLDQTLGAAAQQARVDYLDVWALSAGHDICAADPWVAGQQNAPDALAFHPRPAEQRAIADALSDVAGNL